MWIRINADILVDIDKISGFAYSKKDNVTYGVMNDTSKIEISSGNILDRIAHNLNRGTTVMEVM